MTQILNPKSSVSYDHMTQIENPKSKKNYIYDQKKLRIFQNLIFNI